MAFDVSEYIEEIQQKLNELPPVSRVGFAVWCADALFQRVCTYLAAKTHSEHFAFIMKAFDCLWVCASGETCQVAEAHRLELACAAIDWGDENVADEEQVINWFAIEAMGGLCCALNTCASGSSWSAAKAAENVLNQLDLQLRGYPKSALGVNTNDGSYSGFPDFQEEPRWKRRHGSRTRPI